MNLQKLSLRAGDIAFFDQGQGQPIVFIHGFPLSHVMWRYQTDYFSRGYRVIAPDLAGFGLSPRSQVPATLESHADMIAELLECLSIEEKITLVGLSMGGYVSFQFVRKYGERLRRLILCDTRAVPNPPAAVEAGAEFARRLRAEGTRVAREVMIPRLFGTDEMIHRPEIVSQVNAMIESSTADGLADTLESMNVRPDVRGLLSTIKVPTLVICGEDDLISTPSEMSELASAIPNSKFVVVPSAGHMAPIENPEFVNSSMETFLTESP